MLFSMENICFPFTRFNQYSHNFLQTIENQTRNFSDKNKVPSFFAGTIYFTKLRIIFHFSERFILKVKTVKTKIILPLAICKLSSFLLLFVWILCILKKSYVSQSSEFGKICILFQVQRSMKMETNNVSVFLFCVYILIKAPLGLINET
jgi:hypothetical protein